MFGLKELFANSKAIQYTSYALVVIMIIAGKLNSMASEPTTVSAADIEQSEVAESERILTLHVDSVVDGDTIKAGNNTYRLYLVDAPELNQDHGPESAAFLSALIHGLDISAIERGQDSSGLILIEANFQEVSIPELLVENGIAWAYMVPDEQKTRYSTLQDNAKNAGVGLWASPNPINPVIFKAMTQE